MRHPPKVTLRYQPYHCWTSVYHNRFDSCWRYIVVFVCERRFLVAPIGQFGSARQPLLETSGVRIPVVSSFEEVAGPILRLAGRRLAGRRLACWTSFIIIGSIPIGDAFYHVLTYVGTRLFPVTVPCLTLLQPGQMSIRTWPSR